MNTLIALAAQKTNYTGMNKNALEALYGAGYQVLVSKNKETGEPWYDTMGDIGESDGWWFTSLSALLENECNVVVEYEEESLAVLLADGMTNVIIRWCPMAHQPVYRTMEVKP